MDQKRIKCLHCSKVLFDKRAYVQHARAKHAALFSAPPKAQKPIPAPTVVYSNGQSGSGNVTTMPEHNVKLNKGKGSTQRLVPKAKPKTQEPPLKMLYGRWVGVRAAVEGKPWYCKGCGMRFGLFSEAETHVKVEHRAQVRAFSIQQASKRKRKVKSKPMFGGGSRPSMFSGFGASSGWVSVVSGGLPGLGRNR